VTEEPPPYPDFDGSQVCAQTDPGLFMPDGQGFSARPAKTLCGTCPFADACRDYALWHDVDGIWGGTTLRERQKERQRRGIRLAGQHTPGSLRDQILSANPDISAADLATMLGCSQRSVMRYRNSQTEAA
jgi:hypothetical protein